MNGEAGYLFKEINRQLFLARSKEQAETEEHIDSAVKDLNELKRIWQESQLPTKT